VKAKAMTMAMAKAMAMANAFASLAGLNSDGLAIFRKFRFVLIAFSIFAVEASKKNELVIEQTIRSHHSMPQSIWKKFHYLLRFLCNAFLIYLLSQGTCHHDGQFSKN
jgi:hypothetical protein